MTNFTAKTFMPLSRIYRRQDALPRRGLEHHFGFANNPGSRVENSDLFRAFAIPFALTLIRIRLVLIPAETDDHASAIGSGIATD